MSPATIDTSAASDAPITRIVHWPVDVSAKTRWSFVVVETADGERGIGEATCFNANGDLPGVVEEFADRLRGRPLDAVASYSPLPPGNDRARWAVLSAIEHASWDILGERSATPVHALVGAKARETIALYANVNRRTIDRSPAGFAASAVAAADAGFDLVKIAPFDNLTPSGEDALFAAGLARLRATVDAVQGRARVMVDCHWRLAMRDALALLDLAAELNLVWVECPIPETGRWIAELRRLKTRANELGVDLAGGEQASTIDDFQRYLDEALYDIIMPDVKYVGGIRRLVHIAGMAKTAGVAVSPHNPSGPVAHLATLHAATVCDNIDITEHQFDEHPLFWALSDDPLPQIVNARCAVPHRAGLGFSNDKKAGPTFTHTG